MFTRSDVEQASPARLVPLYLIASYAYYHLNASVMPDDAYDLCCNRLSAEWFFVQHPHAHIIDKEGLSATTAFKLREGDYPLICKVAASSIVTTQEQEPMSNEITLVQIQGAINLPLTADYIENVLKVAPARTDKRAKFWSLDQYPVICDRVAAAASAAKSNDPQTIAAQRPKKAKEEPPPQASEPAGGNPFGAAAASPAPAPAANPFAATTDNPFGSAAPANPASFFG